MTYKINPRAVAGVVVEVNQALGTRREFNHGEVILGLAELIGRTIVEVAQTSIQADELTKVVTSHIKRTIQIGTQATGKTIITGV